MPIIGFILLCVITITLTNEMITRQDAGSGKLRNRQLVHKRHGLSVFRWVYAQRKYFLVNILLHAGLLLLLMGLIGFHTAVCAVYLLLWFLLPQASFLKYAARDEVLYASDFLLFFKVMSVSGKSNYIVTRNSLLALLLEALAFSASFFMRFQPLNLFERLFMTALGLVITGFVMIFIKRDKINDFKYFTKGFALGLLSNAFLYFNEEREGDVSSHSPEAMTAGDREAEDKRPGGWAQQYANPGTAKVDSALAAQPNVILLLSESFWLIEKLPGLVFSEPVAPHFQQLCREGVHGRLMVTPFGGGTCNVESEILTGAPIRYFNPTHSFYHRYMTKPVYALPRIFRDNGYETIALHTFDKQFYNRDKALGFMGFDTYKAKEDLVDPRYEGTYIADSELTQMIVDSYNKKSKPAFILGISMQNHQPYGKSKYKQNPITLTRDSIPISPKLQQAAEAFAHGIHDADRELYNLIAYFKTVKEPTVILFFGDHLGMLGPMFELYKQTGFVSPDINRCEGRRNLEDIRRMYSTDFILWANEQAGGAGALGSAGASKEIGMLGSNFLGNILLNYIGAPKPEYYHFLDTVYSGWPCLNREDLFIDAGGRMYGALPEGMLEIDAVYRSRAKQFILI